MSMAAGEYVSVSSQSDTERADLDRERRELATDGKHEHAEMAANRVILPYRITGRRLVTMLVRPDVADFLDEVTHTSGMELLLEQIQVAAGSSLAGQTLADAQAHHQFDVTVLACKTADGKWNCRPRGATVVEPRSQLIALGTQEQLQRLTELARH